jgi:hypothetical protein
MKYEKALVLPLLGFLSTIPYEIITRILVFFKYGKYSVYELTSLMITLNRPNVILGAVASMLLSSGIAILLYYLLNRLSWQNLIFKSIFISLFSWLLLEVIFMWLIEGRQLIPYRPLNDYYIELFGSILYGITLGLLFQKFLAKKSGFSS